MTAATKLIVTGDWHIHDDSRLRVVEQMCDKIALLQPSVLLLSEVADPWRQSWQQILKTQSWCRLQSIVADREAEGLQTYWLLGNHEFNAKQRYLPAAKIVHKYRTADICVLHGWQFDTVWAGVGKLPGIAPVARFISLRFPRLMIPIYRVLLRRSKQTPGELKQEGFADEWTMAIETVHARARAYAQKQHCRLIIGHTHCPLRFDGLIADWGDMLDSLTWIQVTAGGHITLNRLRQI